MPDELFSLISVTHGTSRDLSGISKQTFERSSSSNKPQEFLVSPNVFFMSALREESKSRSSSSFCVKMHKYWFFRSILPLCSIGTKQIAAASNKQSWKGGIVANRSSNSDNFPIFILPAADDSRGFIKIGSERTNYGFGGLQNANYMFLRLKREAWRQDSNFWPFCPSDGPTARLGRLEQIFLIYLCFH